MGEEGYGRETEGRAVISRKYAEINAERRGISSGGCGLNS